MLDVMVCVTIPGLITVIYFKKKKMCSAKGQGFIKETEIRDSFQNI